MPNYNSAYTGAEIDAAVGAVQAAVAADGIVNTNGLDTILGNYLTSSGAANTYLTQTNAANTYLTKNDAANTYLTQSSAASTYQPLITAGTTGQFYRGDKTWSNTLAGDFVVQGNVSFGNSNTSNYISIHGLTGDAVDTQWANHYFIGNRHWADSESSELVLFAGNDIGNGDSATTVSGSGPDRIRLIAGGHVFQTYTSALSGAFETVCTSSALKTVFEINTNRNRSAVPLHIDIDSDVTPTSSTGSLVIGSLTGLSIGIDANEIMCRSSNAASTLYLQNEGGALQIGAATTISSSLTVSGTVKTSTNNATGGGVWIGDDGDIVDLNDAYCSMRFTSGVRIFSANKGGSAVITLGSGGGITANHGHNFMVGGNEVNFIPDGYNNTFWFNWESFNRAGNATISGYLMGNGKHGYAPVTASAHNTSSSRLIKENITPMTDEEAKKLLDITPVNFDFIKEFSGEKNQFGVIAEDVEPIIPFVVTNPPEGKKGDKDKGIHVVKGVDYSKFAPYLIKMIQIQNQEIEILKSRITSFENKSTI